MSLSNITREAVIAAIAEYEEKGENAFLTEYGFEKARQYFLVHDGKEYPSKAIVGVAHKYISPDNKPLAASEFSGGKNTVEKRLKDLGFTVRSPNISFWWVNHKQTFEYEIEGGYIWSPKNNRNGSFNQTYINLTLTNPGDVVFSYANGRISAIGIVSDIYKEQNRPPEFGKSGALWDKAGWVVPINWTKLDNPIHPKEHLSDISPLLPKINSPLQRNGNGNQICYLASISDELGSFIYGLTSKNNPVIPEIINEIKNEVEEDREVKQIESRDIGQTEKEQLIKARRGQGLFRQNVESIERFCRLTRMTNKRFLIASHIKPWKDSTDREKIDGNNGLLLSPHVDKLFDGGWITFTDSGEILCADKNVQDVMKQWGLNPNMNVGAFSKDQCNYMEYHRNKVFLEEISLK